MNSFYRLVALIGGNVSLGQPMYHFLVEDWDLFEQVLDYSYSKHIKSESQFHPVMMSEPAVSIADRKHG